MILAIGNGAFLLLWALTAWAAGDFHREAKTAEVAGWPEGWPL